MDHDLIRNISALSRISGLLAALGTMRGATITDQLAIEMECAAERLEETICDMIDEVSANDEITVKCISPEFAIEGAADQ